eukprot:3291743-Rhodomonas_salina.3
MARSEFLRGFERKRARRCRLEEEEEEEDAGRRRGRELGEAGGRRLCLLVPRNVILQPRATKSRVRAKRCCCGGGAAACVSAPPKSWPCCPNAEAAVLRSWLVSCPPNP